MVEEALASASEGLFPSSSNLATPRPANVPKPAKAKDALLSFHKQAMHERVELVESLLVNFA